jgi:hypothetical protein
MLLGAGLREAPILEAVPAQIAQMQACPRRSSGMRASCSGSMATSMHQQRGADAPGAPRQVSAQPLGWLHNGQREASDCGAGMGRPV